LGLLFVGNTIFFLFPIGFSSTGGRNWLLSLIAPMRKVQKLGKIVIFVSYNFYIQAKIG
jgi:hypothetical protein